MATVVAVVGTIAGAGTTTVVTALGSALGEQRQRVALVDATAEGSRLTDSIGIEGGGEVTDALRRGTAVGDVQADGPHDVAAFPADPETNWGAIRPDAVDDLYEQLRDRFEFVLVDYGDSPSTDRAAWLGHADEVVIVTDPDVADAVPEIVALAGAFDVPVRGVLASRVPHKEVGDAIDALAETDQTVLGILPEDPTVGAAAEAGTSVLRAEPDSPIATSTWELGLHFRESDHDEPVVPAGTAPESVADTEPSSTTDSDGASTGDSNDASTADSDDATPGSNGEPATDAGSDVGDGFETPDPQPVEEDDGPTVLGTSDDGGSADHETAGDGEKRDEGRREEGGQQDGRSVGGASQADPSEAATRDGIGVGGPEREPERDSERDSAGESSSGIGGLDLGLSSDDGGASDEAGAKGSEPSERSRGSDRDASAGDVDGTDGRDVGNAGEDAAGAEERAARSGESGDGGSDGGSAELSDEEIESVFQETMERVQERREREEDEDE